MTGYTAFFRVSVIILITVAVIMFGLSLFVPLSSDIEAVFDATILVALSLPLIYFLAIPPYVKEKTRTDTELMLVVLLVSFLWSSAGMAQSVDLTVEEHKYIQEHPSLRLGIGVAFPPFQYVEQKNGDPIFKGIAADYATLLSERLGLQMEPEFGISYKRALEMGRSGDIDLFVAIAKTPEREQFLNYTDPYVSYPLVIITREDADFIGSIDDLDGKKVAVIKALANYSKFTNDLSHLSLDYQFEKDVAGVLSAVSFGKAEACVANLAVASYLIRKLGLSNLKVAAPTRWDENHLAMATPSDRPILTGIIQKGLNSISKAEAQKITNKWINLSISPWISPNTVRYVIIPLCASAFTAVLVIMLWNRRLTKEVSLRKETEWQLKYHIDMKNRFLSIISHDLRSPFQAILMNTELIVTNFDRFSSEKIIDLARNSNTAGKKVFALLETLLEWSHLQIDEKPYHPEVVDLSSLTGECCNFLSSVAKAKALLIKNEIDTVSAFADRNAIMTIIRNLLANSIKFTPSNGEIEISAQINGDYVQISIRDTGIGMSEEQIKKVFVDDTINSTKGTDGEIGTGLGLPLCKELVESSGGQLWIESAEGEGCQFHFTLPAQESPA